VTEATPTPADYVASILAAATDYRIADYDRLTAEARERLPPEELVRDVFGPVLRAAGDRWEKGLFSVVQEHMLTAAVRRQLTYVLDAQNRAATGPCVAFTTLSGERHEMGSLMLAVIAASRGFNAVYLGPDLPAAEVGRFCGQVSVAVVAISIVTSPEVIDAGRQLRELRAVLPPAIAIWLGGKGAALLDPAQLPADSILVRDLADFDSRLAALPHRSDRP
jgi:MerR family transcriptional regulator, light-induced transcriptional regulator